MAIRTVAQAAADVRLSSDKANADWERIRRDLIAKATRLEADMAIAVPVTVDQNSLRAVASGLGRLQQVVQPLVVPVTVDTDQALDDLTALTDLDLSVTAHVEADTQDALGEIISLTELGPEITLPVRIDTEGITSQVAGLGTGAFSGLTVPVRANTAEVTQAVTQVTRLAEGPFTVKFQADTTDIPRQVNAVGQTTDGVTVPIIGDNSEAVAAVQAVGDTAQPVTVSVLADTDPLKEAVAATKLPPLHVPVTAAEVGPGIAKSAGLARIRAELASLEQTPAHIPVVADPADAIGTIEAISTADYPPATVPVVSDTTGFVLPGAGGGPPPDPVEVPVEVDAEAAQAKLQQFGTSIGKTVEPGAREGGRQAGTAFGREMLATANKILTLGAITLGGFVATSLVTGFQRFTTIQDSTASLTVALQDAAAAGKLLDDVLNVVRGTPFRLDDFARAATNLVSFGIAADKVPRFLTAIGEAAATRGSQANQFAQSLATIFGQVQAIGKINGEDIWQFGNVGVDVLRILGNTLDKTTGEIRKMVSEGLIPAEFALEAISSGILNGTTGINGATVAFSGVMEKLGDTLSGSIENFGAAEARLGVAVIQPLSQTLVKGFQGLTHVIDNLTARTKEAFSNFAETDFIEGVNAFFEDLPSKIDPAIAALDKLGPALAPLGVAFGALGLGAISNVLGPLGALVPGVTSLAGAATVAGTAFAILTPQIRDELIPVLIDLGKVGAEVGGTFVRGVSDAFEGLTPTILRAIGIFRDQIPAIQTFLGTAFGEAGRVGEAALPILNQLADFAEQALPTAFQIATNGIKLLGETAVAAAPVVSKLIAVGEDLLPTVSALADAAEVIGGVLIPALDAFGEVIGSIPTGVLSTLLGIFLGFKTAQFVGGVFETIGRSAQKATTEVQGFVRNVALGVPIASNAAIAGGAAIAGAFSGMALASEDSATRITGALTGIGTVLTGLALGGVPGGVFAAIGVGIGYVAQGFINARNEAKQLEQAVSQLADRIRSEFTTDLITPEGLINSKAIEDQFSKIGGDGLLTLKQKLGIGLQDIQTAVTIQADQVRQAIEQGLDPGDVTFFNDFVDEQIGRLAKLEDAAKDFKFSDAVNKEIAHIDLVKSFEGDDVKLNQFAHQVADEFGLAFKDVQAQIKATRDAQAELGPDFRKTMEIIGSATSEAVKTQEALGVQVTAVGTAAQESGNQQVDAVQAAKDAVADSVLTNQQLLDLYQQEGDAAVSSADRAKAAYEDFGNTLDEIKNKLDLTVAAQNTAADLRGIGDALDEVVNVNDLNKVDQINKQMDTVRKRIADLQVDLATKTARANEEAGLLEGRIRKAEAIGAVNAAAELRRQLGQVFDDANDVRNNLDDEFARLNELKGQLTGLTTEPITRMEQLTKQAADANLSFFDFLLKAPTKEAKDFFQGSLASTVQGGLDEVNRISDEQGPIAGARAAETFLTNFRTGLTDAGIDPTTADKLIQNLLPPDILETNAQTAAVAAIDKFQAEFDAINEDPNATTLQIKTTALDLDQQRTEIESFLQEHPEINLPVGIDATDFNTEIETLKSKAAQLGINAERERFGQRNPEALGDFIKATQTDAEKAAAESAQKILDEVNALDPDTMDVPIRVTGIQQEITNLQTDLAKANIKLPVELTIETLQVQLDAAEIQAKIQAQLQAAQKAAAASLPPFFGINSRSFAEGGFTGVIDAPHTAQIASGYRMWAEPETGGEAYIPLGMGKRVGALGVFMKIADMFDFDVRPRAEARSEAAIERVFESVAAAARGVMPVIPDLKVPDVNVHVHVNAPPSRPPISQEQFDGALHIDKIERLVIGDGAPARKRASQFIRELKKRAVGI